MRHARLAVPLFCVGLLVACSTLSDDPGLLPLGGCWSAFNNVPGSSLVLQLTEGQTTINGTGTFRMEAGPSGNLTVTGTRTGAEFDVELFYDIGTHRSFLGIVTKQGKVRCLLPRRPPTSRNDANPVRALHVASRAIDLVAQYLDLMAENKTKATSASVSSYLSSIKDAERREDCESLAKLLQKATREPPKMWGSSIVGFGSYHYKYDSGREGDSCLVGFSSRATDITVYLSAEFPGRAKLLPKLGKHKAKGGCVHIRRLSDIDPNVLQELAADCAADKQRQHG